MHKSMLTIGLLSATLLPAGAFAANGTWTGNVEFGYVKTGGNTDTSNLNLKAKAETSWEKWRNAVNFEAASSTTDSVTTAERYLLSDQASRQYTEHSYSFVFLGYENDRFSGYDYRLSGIAGYGYRVYSEPDLTMDLEVGPGLRRSKLDTGSTDNEFIGRGAFKLKWLISKTSTFSEDINSDVGDNSVVTRSVTALQSKINGSLSSKITYTVAHNSDVPDPSIKKTDTELAVTLVYTFE